jgi:hypothetical protein
MESAVWGLIGTIVGALASIGTTWLSGRHSLALQEQATSLDRVEQARAFQRQNLLELQDALHDALRLVGRAHFEDLASFSKGGEWGRSLLSEEVDEGFRIAQRKVLILIERVADDDLRSRLKKTMQSTGNVMFAQNQPESVAALKAVSGMTQDTLEQIGRVLRALY